ncbi:MAG: hypothetical protein Q8O97_00185 [bacterium]|nr:hypothetical protein [bacterium]
MMFFIPVMLILGVLLFTLAGSVFQDIGIDLSVPDFSKYLTPQVKSEEQKPTTAAQQNSQVYTQTKLSPRPPPAPQTPQPQAPEKSTVSPFEGKITISSFTKPSGVEPFQARLQTNITSGTSVSLTGWRLKSKFQGETTIGLGIERYHPLSNSQPTENIIIRSSDTVIFLGEQSPFGRGIHFRTNACFGYLKPYYPSLPGTSSCSQDKPTLEQVSNLAPTCQDFILKNINFSSCVVPNLGPVATNTECVNYIMNAASGFNYTGCYEKRKNDANFLSREWYIYSDTQLGNSLHDTITLYDQNGLVVDTYIY